MTSPAPTAPDAAIEAMLADRYGRTKSPRRWVTWGLLAVAAAALLGYVIWSTIAQSLGSVDYDTIGYTTPDAHSIEVRFQVTAQPDTAFVCAIEAQDEQHGIVGWRVVEYESSSQHTRTFAETVPTTAPATTGLVTSCWIP